MGQSWTNKARKLGMLCAVNLSLYLNCFAGVDQGEKKVTLNVVEENCVKVFKQIEKQTKMSFFYSTSDIKLPGKVSISVVNAALDEVMGRILEGTNLEWIYTDNVITIRKKKGLTGGGNGTGSVADSNINMITVTGKVVQADGTGIPGATVRVKRTGDGVTTDGEGEFSLPRTRKNDLLTVSFIGYETREIHVSGNSILVKLNIVVSDLDETVIKGYYSTTKRLNTGNVSTIKSEEIERQPVNNPLAALHGRVPGLQITQATGVPGGGYNVQIRGRSSIGFSNPPLYIIDGVPYNTTSSTTIGSIGYNVNKNLDLVNPLNVINPLDIERIDVLKDADATAIYGSRGANGVILITTKKGKSGLVQVIADVYTGWGKVTNMMKLLNTQQYLEMRHEAFTNDNVTPTIANAYDLLVWDTTKYTDWQKKFIGGTATITNAQLSISGGNLNTHYLVGSSYRRETTVFPGDFANKRVTVNLGLNTISTNQKFKLDLSSNYAKSYNSMPASDLTQNALTLAPNTPDFIDPNGNLLWPEYMAFNPLAFLNNNYTANTDNFLSNINLSYQLLPGLDVKASLGYSKTTVSEISTNPKSSVPPNSAGFAFSRFSNSSNQSWVIEPQIAWEKQLNIGKLGVLLGSTFQASTLEGQQLEGTGYTTDALLKDINSAGTITVQGSNYYKYKYNAFWGRFNYNWKDKYLINLTARRDGSSRFGPGNQFGNFGAIGAAWIFSNEAFLKNHLPFLSFGKIRSSYGVTGSDGIPDYQYLQLWGPSFYPFMGTPSLIPTNIGNPNYGWEQNRKLEASVNLGLLNDNILVSVSWYRNRSDNQLIGMSLPPSVGFSAIQANLPALVQNSGWEIELATVNFKRNGFEWVSAFNITLPKNKLLKYPELDKSQYAEIFALGKSLYVWSAAHYLGVDPTTGIYKFEDVDGNGSGVDFPTDYQRIKELKQDFYGGMNNSFQYKGLELNIFFQFVKQTGMNPLMNRLFSVPGSRGNQPLDILQRWRNSKDVTDIQKFTTGRGNGSEANQAYRNGINFSDNVITDASFVRLKNLSLSYSVPANWLRRIKVQQIRIYTQAQNLFTITSYKGMDPESQGFATIPPLKVYTIGLKLTL